MKMKYNLVFNFMLFYLIYIVANISADENCGIVTPLDDDKIVNGRDLDYPYKYPWYAALLLASNSRQLVCGGSLIHERHVLTAAHCFKPYFDSVNKKKIRLEDIYIAKLGINNICIAEDNTAIFSSIKIHIHEKYYNDGRYYDIALMVLDAKATDFVPICLPPVRYESNNRTNFQGTIMGLGKESANAWKTPCTVKEAVVPLQPDTVCKEMLFGSNRKKNLLDVFCAGYPEGKIDTCQGDSGGPLQVYRESSQSWMILGITSFGYGCAQPKFYGIYTDVSHYLNWIDDKIKYDENKSYEFELPILVKGKSNSKPSLESRKYRSRAFNNWITKMLED